MKLLNNCFFRTTAATITLVFTFVFIFICWVRDFDPESSGTYFGFGVSRLLMLTFALGIVLFFLKRSPFALKFSMKDIIVVCYSYFILVLLIFTHLPVTVERSISTWMLEDIHSLQHQNQPISVSMLSQRFIDKYALERSPIEKRIMEQVHLGNLQVRGNTVELTDRGRIAHHLITSTRWLFKLPKLESER